MNEFIAECDPPVSEDGRNNMIEVFFVPRAFPSSKDALPGSISNGMLSARAKAGACASIVGG